MRFPVHIKWRLKKDTLARLEIAFAVGTRCNKSRFEPQFSNPDSATHDLARINGAK